MRNQRICSAIVDVLQDGARHGVEDVGAITSYPPIGLQAEGVLECAEAL